MRNAKALTQPKRTAQMTFNTVLNPDGLVKRPYDESGELEELDADGDADDGDAPAKPLEEEGDGGEETAENDPDDVANSFHFFAS